jgi:hypothetical protein
MPRITTKVEVLSNRGTRRMTGSSIGHSGAVEKQVVPTHIEKEIQENFDKRDNL